MAHTGKNSKILLPSQQFSDNSGGDVVEISHLIHKLNSLNSSVHSNNNRYIMQQTPNLSQSETQSFQTPKYEHIVHGSTESAISIYDNDSDIDVDPSLLHSLSASPSDSQSQSPSESASPSQLDDASSSSSLLLFPIRPPVIKNTFTNKTHHTQHTHITQHTQHTEKSFNTLTTTTTTATACTAPPPATPTTTTMTVNYYTNEMEEANDTDMAAEDEAATLKSMDYDAKNSGSMNTIYTKMTEPRGIDDVLMVFHAISCDVNEEEASTPSLSARTQSVRARPQHLHTHHLTRPREKRTKKSKARLTGSRHTITNTNIDLRQKAKRVSHAHTHCVRLTSSSFEKKQSFDSYDDSLDDDSLDDDIDVNDEEELVAAMALDVVNADSQPEVEEEEEEEDDIDSMYTNIDEYDQCSMDDELVLRAHRTVSSACKQWRKPAKNQRLRAQSHIIDASQPAKHHKQHRHHALTKRTKMTAGRSADHFAGHPRRNGSKSKPSKPKFVYANTGDYGGFHDHGYSFDQFNAHKPGNPFVSYLPSK